MATVSLALTVDLLTVDDPASFTPQVIGFIGRETGSDALADAPVKFSVMITEDTQILDGVSLARGRTVGVQGLLDGVAVQFQFEDPIGAVVCLTALTIG